MRPHLAYLRYVLLHKWYVFRFCRLLGVGLWRSLIHDLSKFRPSEWRPYVDKFYRPTTLDEYEHRQVARRFDYAWLLHQHRNPHHWQHWILKEDSGKTLVLPMSSQVALEMLADWLSAGSKVLRRPTLPECVAETVHWYAANHDKILLRGAQRTEIEAVLISLCDRFELYDAAMMPNQRQIVTLGPNTFGSTGPNT